MSDLEFINLRLDNIQKNQEKILLRLDELAQAMKGFNPNEWLDSIQVQEILNISASTVYRRKKAKKLVPKDIGGSERYFAPDIYDMRDQYLK